MRWQPLLYLAAVLAATAGEVSLLSEDDSCDGMLLFCVLHGVCSQHVVSVRHRHAGDPQVLPRTHQLVEHRDGLQASIHGFSVFTLIFMACLVYLVSQWQPGSGRQSAEEKDGQVQQVVSFVSGAAPH